jgi:hypothetical protein
MEQIVQLKAMKNQNFHSFRRWIQKSYIRFYRKFYLLQLGSTEEEVVNDSECVQICRKLIQAEDSVLLIAPLSEKRYLKNERMGIYIILQGSVVQVINHIYSYTVVLSEKSKVKLIKYYDDAVEKRRQEFEEEITSNIKHSLKTILSEILVDETAAKK